jgi:hypothetical protein
MPVFHIPGVVMKLQHLPIGARFEYEGQVFVKTGPLTAASEQGGSRLIPRYATLKPVEAQVAEARGKSRSVDVGVVRLAFDDFYRSSRELLDEAAWPQLDAARQKFLEALK